MSYICPCCGKAHEGLPDIAFERPIHAYHVPEHERAQRVRLTSDLCVVDEEYYFIRGLIEIPIRGQASTLGIGAWISQKPDNFRTYENNFDSADIGPFFGWLSNDFMFMGESALNLKTMAHFNDAALRPNIVLQPTEHPLSVAQKEGITLDQAWEFVHEYLDPEAA